MGWFHKKRLFGNNYPVTYHIWQGYLTNIASEHTHKLRLPCQNCHGYFTTFASKHRSKTIGYLPLLPFLKKTVTKIATVTSTKLPRLLYQNCHMKSLKNDWCLHYKISFFVRMIWKLLFGKAPKSSFQMASNGVTIFWIHVVFCCHMEIHWILGDMCYFIWVHGIGISCQF